MPRTTVRVVCGRDDVIATLLPTRTFVSVDLPAFGRPTNDTKPLRNSGTCGLCHPAPDRPRDRRTTEGRTVPGNRRTTSRRPVTSPATRRENGWISDGSAVWAGSSGEWWG